MSTREPETKSLIITVNVGRGYAQVWPDPAEVVQGTRVEWQVEVEKELPTLTFQVYFSNGSPTGWSVQRIMVEHSKRGAGPSAIAAIARDPGEYKYGVKATEFETGEVIADDDPYLIVRPRNE